MSATGLPTIPTEIAAREPNRQRPRDLFDEFGVDTATTSAAPANVASQVETQPASGDLFDEFGVDLGNVGGAMPAVKVEPPRGPMARAESKIPAAEPSATPVRGFFGNFTLRDVGKAMREDSALAGVAKYVTGNTDAERARKRQALGMDRDPVEDELNVLAEQAYQAGGYDSAEYQRVDATLKRYRETRDNPEFHVADLWRAFKDDPGATTAEFAKAIVADPELLLTPLGWEKAAAAAYSTARAAGAAASVAKAARVAGGLAGSGATAAAIEAPVSAAHQLGETGAVDAGRTARDTATAAAAGSALTGALQGVATAVRSLRGLRGRPGVDAATIDAEIATLTQRAEEEGARAGVSAEDTRAALARMTDDHAPPRTTSTEPVAVSPIDDGAHEAATSPRNDVPEPKDAPLSPPTTKPIPEAVDAHSVGAAEASAIAPTTKLGEAWDRVTATVKRAGRDLMDVTGAKAITFLDDLAKASPTARKLRNLMEHEEFARDPVAPSFYERVSMRTGEFVGRLDTELDALRGAFRRAIPEKVSADLAALLRGERVERPAAAVREAALRIRDLLNDVRRYAQRNGLEVGFLPNYFPRVYRRAILESDAGRAEFVRVLQRHGIDATDADEIAAKIVNTDGILAVERVPTAERFNPDKPAAAVEPGRMLRQRTRIDKNLETARTLAHIPDRELAPFLESNAAAVLTRYVTGVIRRAEHADIFGAGEGKLNKMVRDIVVEAGQSGRPVRPAEIQRIYDLADAMQWNYQRIRSPAGAKANNFLIAYQYLRTLPLATISSLSEPFLTLARGRPGTIPRAIARSLNHVARETIRSVYRRFPKAEATKALEDIGLGLDAAIAERLTASFGGELTKFTEAFFKLNMLHQFTRWSRVLANEAGKLMVERHLKDLAQGVTGKRGQQMRRELAELGVDADQGIAWIKRGAPRDDPFGETIKAAGLRFTNEVVMNPRPTNRPMWQSNPHFHLLAQLKGYQTVFGNTVMKRWWDMMTRRGAYENTRNAAKIATAGVLMTWTAVLGNELREWIKHGDGGNPKFHEEDPLRTVYRGMERVGFLGAFQFASDSMFAHRFGSPAIAQIAGPAASQANELLEAAGRAAEGKERPIAREIVNAIPLANVIPKARTRMVDAMSGISADERALLDLRQQIGGIVRTIERLRQQGKVDEAKGLQQQERDTLRLRSQVDAAAHDVAVIDRRRKAIEDDPRKTDDQKAAALERLDDDREKIIRRAVGRINMRRQN